MGFRRAIPLLLIAALAISCPAADAPEGMVLIPAGSYRPLFRSEKDPKTSEVAAFYLDAKPVTNGEFLDVSPVAHHHEQFFPRVLRKAFRK